MEKMGNRGVDLTGQRFGKLLVLHRDTEKQSGPGRHIYWICQCDCGKIVSKAGHHLRDGQATACSFACKNAIPIGTEFGDLTVIEQTEQRSKNGGSVLYKCKCRCGNKELIAATVLRANRKFCCSKCSKSQGEIEIEKVLRKNNIEFLQQYKAPGCINPKTKMPLIFDFYLPQQNCLIEYDGEQHFYKTTLIKSDEQFEAQQFRDQIKNEYCKKNDISLIRIPYTQLRQITIEMLLPESSKFILK